MVSWDPVKALISLLALSAVGCGSVSGDPDGATSSDGPPPMPDGSGAARCNPALSFGAPTFVASLSSSFEESALSLTRDELTAYVSRSNPGNTLLSATRASTSVAFPMPATDPALAAVVNQAGTEYCPTPTADALVMYFHRQTPNDIGIYAATRASQASPFDAGNLVSVGGMGLLDALTPAISADGQTLYWLDFQQFLLHSAPRAGTATQFGLPRVTSTISMFNPVLSADGLTLYYSDGMETDVLASTRASTSDVFGTGVPVANVNSPERDAPLFLSNDGCVLYLKSSRPGGAGGDDIWVARRPQ
jgi:hypothetical protein